MNNRKFRQIGKNVRLNILKRTYKANSSHIGSCLSIVEILIAIYFHKLIKIPLFILSKGHAGLALYSILVEKKIISKKILNTYGEDNTILMGHISHKVEGIIFSSGSLGHGLPFAIGKAFKFKRYLNKKHVYVLLSDGELNEGTTWEGLLFANHHKLDNLTIIIDYNKIQSLGKVSEIIKLEPLKKKFESFGCLTFEVDGHNIHEIQKTLKKKTTNKPKVIIANTIKGKGISFMENNNLWHYKSPDKFQIKKAIKEIQNA